MASKTNNKPEQNKDGKTEKPKPSLPHDLLSEIFSRLPIDSLVQFKCVSRHWHDIFSEPSFIDIHTRHAPSQPGLIFNSATQYNALIFFDVETMKDKTLPFKPKIKENINNNDDDIVSIHSSCNGLVLVECEQGYYVYNPITQFVMKVPPLDKGHGKFDLWSLAYDSGIKKFKVVCGTKRENGYTCNIFTIGVDTWREVPIPSHNLYMFPPVFANGHLHWMIHSKDIDNMEDFWGEESDSEGYILTMDVNREVFSRTPHPKCLCGVYTLLETNGLLCFIDHVSNDQLKIWILKDLEKQDWGEECSINATEGNVPFNGFLVDTTPIAIFGENGRYKVIFKSTSDQFFLYDTDTDCWHEIFKISSLISFRSRFEDNYSPFRHANSLRQ